MNIFRYSKILKTLRLLQHIVPRAEWLQKTRAHLVALSGYSGETKSASYAQKARTFRFAPALIAILAVLGASAGTSFAAKDAIPTDSLYSVKLLSERVQGIFVFGDNRRAEFALVLASRRLEEAQRLADIGSVQVLADVTAELLNTKSAVPVVALWQPVEGAPVLVEVVLRFEDALALAKSRIDKVERAVSSTGNAFSLIKIAQQLEKLQEQQNKLQEKLRIHVPELALALESAQAASLDVQQDVDKIIITLNTVTLGATSSTTTTISLNQNENARERAEKAIERAEHKISIVEAKLSRFSDIPLPVVSDDDEEDEGDDNDEDNDDDEDQNDNDEDDDEAFVPPGLQKKASLFGFRQAFAKDNDDNGRNRGRKSEVKIKIVKPKEISKLFGQAQEKIADAKEKLVQAKSAFAEGNYAKAHERAIEAFKKAAEAEGKINRGIGFGVIVPPDTVAPQITNITVQNISTTSASIRWTTNEVSDSRVQYGTTSNHGLLATNGILVLNHNIVLGGLAQNTVYHFQVVSRDFAGNTATSSGNTFITSSATTSDTSAPIISSIAVSSISTSSATVTWVTNELASTRVNFGTSSSYGLFASTSGLATSHAVALAGLNPSTLYHFQVVSQDVSGNTATSSDGTFTTNSLPDTTAPVISAINVLGVSTSSATIAWTTNELSTSRVDYGTSSAYGLSASSSTLTTAHSLPISVLSEGTLYHFRVTSVDGAGNSATSSDNTFTSATSSTP